jgi:uncharacterized protein YueI
MTDYSLNIDYNDVQLDSNDISRRSLINPRFKIDLSADVFGGVLTVTTKLTALKDITSDNLTLYLAVTEKEKRDKDLPDVNGDTIFFNVFRKFIPDAGGISLKNTWIIEKTLNSSDIEVIAFVQHSVNKEVFQVASEIKKNLIVGIEKPKGKGGGFALYPNPAKNQLTIKFGEALKAEADITILDFKGTIVRSVKVESGSKEFTISNLGLHDGIYLLRISSGGIDFGYKKLIVSGS